MRVSRARQARQCKALTRTGRRCNGWAIGGSDFCFTHSPQNAEARAVARRKGGYHRKTAVRVSGDTPITIATMADVLQLVNAVIADTWQQDNGAARSRVLLACASVAIDALQVGDLEARLAALEQKAGTT